MTDNLITIQNIEKSYFTGQGLLGWDKHEEKILKNLSLNIKTNQIFGLIGESGSGKSTLAKIILLMTKFKGDIYFKDFNLNDLNRAELRKLRSKMQIVFQNPYSSLNPMHRIGEIIAEPLKLHKVMDQTAIGKRVNELIELVGLSADAINKYPHEFSGGQRQRIAIARALSLNPEFLILDEPVSALDVSVQAQIINLLVDLKNQFNLTYLFISHNLDLVRLICDEIAIMYFGQIIETGPTELVYQNPQHPYTKLLLSCILKPDTAIESLPIINDERTVKSLRGCPFFQHCPYAQNKCQDVAPLLEPSSIEPNHQFACHYPVSS